MARGIRVDRIDLQYFKGFTRVQSLELGGRHLFLLGRNGLGKSSIVEGVRWGLFGSLRRPGDVVANRNISGSCEIVLALMKDDQRYVLKRRLTPAGRSDSSLTDEAGKSMNMSEVLPTLESVDSGESVHLVMIPQDNAGRRPLQDMKPFERVIYSHLGLLDVRELVVRLRAFCQDQEQVEIDVSQQVQVARQMADEQWRLEKEGCQRLLDHICPDGGLPPSEQSSIARVREFIGRVAAAARLEVTDNSQSDLETLLSAARQVVASAARIDPSNIKNQIEQVDREIADLRRLAGKLAALKSRYEATTMDLATVEEQLAAVLDGRTLDEVAATVEQCQQDLARRDLLKQVIITARTWADSWDEAIDLRSCPVCNREVDPELFRHQLKERWAAVDEESANVAAALSAGMEMNQTSIRLSVRTSDLRRQVRDFEAEIRLQDEELELHGVDEGGAEAKIEDLSDRASTLRALERSNQDQIRDWQRMVGGFEEELKYHQGARRVLELEAKRRDIGRIEQEAQEGVVSLGKSARLILQQLEQSLREALEVELPALNQRLTRVFKALTDHPVYDRVVIQQKASTSSYDELVPRVASRTRPDLLQDGEQVLNGQAIEALRLVPYFAFADLDESRDRLCLVMLDDPTQAFDEDHIDLFVRNLADLGKHVQLIVATHEGDRFRRAIPKYFGENQYAVFNVVGFAPEDGPTLEPIHGGL